jgi:hypothetical protein
VDRKRLGVGYSYFRNLDVFGYDLDISFFFRIFAKPFTIQWIG